MAAIQPQFIKDASGANSHVVLTAEEFERLLQRLEDLEDVRLYDEAKAEDDGEGDMTLEDYRKERAMRSEHA